MLKYVVILNTIGQKIKRIFFMQIEGKISSIENVNNMNIILEARREL